MNEIDWRHDGDLVSPSFRKVADVRGDQRFSTTAEYHLQECCIVLVWQSLDATRERRCGYGNRYVLPALEEPLHISSIETELGPTKHLVILIKEAIIDQQHQGTG
ncbi:MAG TPA: hypothetical protein VHX44_11490 [Planctomycetota bacterium]|nr:hypothetical protein [Planctomycetota bacterium]